jgi:hypothetical protein
MNAWGINWNKKKKNLELYIGSPSAKHFTAGAIYQGVSF